MTRSRYLKDGEFTRRLSYANSLGYGRGYNNKHHEDTNFVTGAEYLAWLAGHREGQKDRLADSELERNQKAAEEYLMLRMLNGEKSLLQRVRPEESRVVTGVDSTQPDSSGGCR